jgi:hypothetical protein
MFHGDNQNKFQGLNLQNKRNEEMDRYNSTCCHKIKRELFFFLSISLPKSSLHLHLHRYPCPPKQQQQQQQMWMHCYLNSHLPQQQWTLPA